MCKESKRLNEFKEWLNGIKKEINDYPEKLKRLELEIMDIEHILGLEDNNVDVVKLVALATELRSKLQERWNLKHRYRLIKPVCYFLQHQEGIFDNLDQTIKTILKAEHNLNNLCYHPRIRNDLADKYAKECDSIIKMSDLDLDKLKKLEQNNAS